MNLISLGWDSFFANNLPLNTPFKPARVVKKHNRGYDVANQKGVFFARITGSLKKNLPKEEWPSIGDWVLCSEDEYLYTIQAILPRKTKISRKVSGKTSEEQVLAVNADTIFLVISLFEDFNLRKIERYLALIAESKANAVIILNKVDLVDDVSLFLKQMDQIFNKNVVVKMNALSTSTVLETLDQYTKNGQTTVFLGSSGAGKSTIVNALLGEERQAVNSIGKNKKGQHTTTSRDMIFLKNGGILIDNPGIRELRVWIDDEDSLSESFADIEDYAQSCKFRNCQHQNEPCCAVQEKINEGILDINRLNNWRKLHEESSDLLLRRKEFGRQTSGSKGNSFVQWTHTARKNSGKRGHLR